MPERGERREAGAAGGCLRAGRGGGFGDGRRCLDRRRGASAVGVAGNPGLDQSGEPAPVDEDEAVNAAVVVELEAFLDRSDARLGHREEAAAGGPVPAGDGLVDRHVDEAGHDERPAVELDPYLATGRLEVALAGERFGGGDKEEDLLAVQRQAGDRVPESFTGRVDADLRFLDVEQLVLVIGQIADPAGLVHDHFAVDLEVGGAQLRERADLGNVEVVQGADSIGRPGFAVQPPGNDMGCVGSAAAGFGRDAPD